MLKINPRLRRLLAKLYNKVKKIQILSDDSGVDYGDIGWKESAYVVWFQVLRECLKDPSKFTALISMVKEEYPKYKPFLNEAEKMYAGGSSELIEALEKMKLEKLAEIGSIDRFNCGRTALSNEFWKPQDIDITKTPLLTGIILGNDKERPASLAKRLVYEYLQEMEANQKLVLYKRDAQDFDIKEISIDAKTDKSLEWAIDQYLEEYKGQESLAKYGAIAHSLIINISESFNVVESIASVALEKFKAFSEKHKAHNLLMIIFQYSDTIDTSGLQKELRRIDKEEDTIKYFEDLGHISSKEIIDWFFRMGAENTEMIAPYFDAFIEDELEGSGKNPLADSKGIWAMDKMLLVQDQIFNYAMKKDGTNIGPEDV